MYSVYYSIVSFTLEQVLLKPQTINYSPHSTVSLATPFQKGCICCIIIIVCSKKKRPFVQQTAVVVDLFKHFADTVFFRRSCSCFVYLTPYILHLTPYTTTHLRIPPTQIVFTAFSILHLALSILHPESRIKNRQTY